MKTHENLVNIFMVYSQDFPMFFMSFSWLYLPGFPWVWYREKCIKKAMKIHLILPVSGSMKTLNFLSRPWNNHIKTLKYSPVWCWLLMGFWKCWIEQHTFKVKFMGFSWHYKKFRAMKNAWFPPEVGIINDPWKCSKRVHGLFMAPEWPDKWKIYADTLNVISWGREACTLN